jgi:hypothetical protein
MWRAVEDLRECVEGNSRSLEFCSSAFAWRQEELEEIEEKR